MAKKKSLGIIDTSYKEIIKNVYVPSQYEGSGVRYQGFYISSTGELRPQYKYIKRISLDSRTNVLISLSGYFFLTDILIYKTSSFTTSSGNAAVFIYRDKLTAGSNLALSVDIYNNNESMQFHYLSPVNCEKEFYVGTSSDITNGSIIVYINGWYED